MVKPAARELVKKEIGSHKVVIFSKSYCPYCTKAKRALSTVLPAAKVTVIELDHRDDGGDIQDALAEMTGGRSVPRVFVEEEFIGGGDDTERLARSGELAKIVANV